MADAGLDVKAAAAGSEGVENKAARHGLEAAHGGMEAAHGGMKAVVSEVGALRDDLETDAIRIDLLANKKEDRCPLFDKAVDALLNSIFST